MAWGRIVVSAALVSCLALCVGAAASAGAGASPGTAITPIGMTLKASHGYALSIYGFEDNRAAGGESEHRDQALMLVTRHDSAVEYISERATVNPGSIQADFGEVGEVDVTYRASGRTRRQKSACQAKPVNFDPGFYEGRIEFHGEEGYADASATRARGDLQFLLDVVCSSPFGESSGPGLPGARLVARSRPGSMPSLELRAIQNRPGARVRVGAAILEKTEGVFAIRYVSADVPAPAFAFDQRLRSARLSPPAPFSGHGSFHRDARSPWTGNLSVDFPGHSDVSLTASGMRAGLSRARLTREPVHAVD